MVAGTVGEDKEDIRCGLEGEPTFFAGLLVIGSRPDRFSVGILTENEWSLKRAKDIINVVGN